MQDRLLFIDGLRGVAASMVVVYHLASRTPAARFTAYGKLGVAIFFVLSGFVIAMSIADQRISMRFLLRFAARRSIRLDPPYWTSIIVAVALAAISAHFFGVSKEFPSLAAVVAHLFYLQDILGYPAISPIYWTLCLEIQFYLVLILILWSVQSLRLRIDSPPIQLLLFAVLELSLLEQSGATHLSHAGIFLPYWFAFFLGAMCYWTLAGKMRDTLFLLGIALTLLCLLNNRGAWFVTAGATALIIYTAARIRKMSSWLSNAAVQFLGRISYSLYLFHPFVGWSAMSFAMTKTNIWLAMAVGAAASLLSAWIAYTLVERQSIKLSRRIRMSRRPPVGASVSQVAAE